MKLIFGKNINLLSYGALKIFYYLDTYVILIKFQTDVVERFMINGAFKGWVSADDEMREEKKYQ